VNYPVPAPADWEEKAIAAGYHSPQFIQMFLGYLKFKLPANLEHVTPKLLLDTFAEFEAEMAKR
jgi:hypothetical protein